MGGTSGKKWNYSSHISPPPVRGPAVGGACLMLPAAGLEDGRSVIIEQQEE